MIDCYVINLDRSPERWRRIESHFKSQEGIHLVRVPAVDISSLPEGVLPEEYRPLLFRFLNGRTATHGEIGCYLSHLKALRTFLNTDASWAMICEDDIVPRSEMSRIAHSALEYEQTWDLLRLGRCRERGSFAYAHLPEGYDLRIAVMGFAYAAGYMVNRRGAQRILENVPHICVPWDLALHRGWAGIRESVVIPDLFDMDETSAVSTLGVRKIVRRPWSPLWWSAQMYKIYARIVRYSIQFTRVLGRTHHK